MSSPPHDPLIGIRLDGRYRITGVLGRGGMGVVYEGVHEELGRAVAIKVLGADTAAEPVVVERFVREARVASGLAHGNIVDVSDLGRLPDGRPYLVMPKVRGVDFATLLEREGRMAPARVVSLLRGVAAALDLVHAEGLVHRDVKPENLMHVVRADGSENVMLLDFGIAALLGAKAVRLTAEGMRCGTPAYMAPESVTTGDFDARTDVYALATVAFEMLTGRLPFDARSPTAVMDQKTRNAAPSLNAVTNGTHFDAALERVVARGLARNPELRFSSTGEFVAALEHALVTGAVDEPNAADAHTSVLPAPAGAGVRSVADPTAINGTAPELRGGASVATARSSAGADRDTEASPRFVRISRRAVVLIGLAIAVLALARHRAPSSQPQRAAMRPIAVQSVQAAPPTPAAPATEAAPALPNRIADTPAPPLPRALPRAAHRAALQRVDAPQEPSAIAPVVANDPPVATVAAGSSIERAADQELLAGHLARAVELFERAIAEDADDAAAFRGLGLAQERLGHNAAAVRAYRSAVALEPEGVHSAKLRERLLRLGAGD